MSTHLSAAQLQSLQQQLLASRAQLLAAQALHRGGVSRAEHAHDMLTQDGDDAPQRDADRELDLAQADREVVALAGIDAALQRLAHGHYGRCSDCGQGIAAARLALAPAALHCVACATARERGTAKPATL